MGLQHPLHYFFFKSTFKNQWDSFALIFLSKLNKHIFKLYIRLEKNSLDIKNSNINIVGKNSQKLVLLTIFMFELLI